MVTAWRFSIALLLVLPARAAPRQHIVFLGNWRPAQTASDSGDSRPIKIRRLIVDGRLRDYTFGQAHDVTESVFVIRRVFRINDTLPDDRQATPSWVWRMDGWISVDRMTGHIAQLNLPAFDAELSEVSWYRDYAAYCGTSDDGARAYLMVWQVGKKKPALRKEFAGPSCEAPRWARGPSRVTFIAAGEKNSFLIRARGADPQPDAAEEEAQDK
jgi:hypothetical protein